MDSKLANKTATDIATQSAADASLREVSCAATDALAEEPLWDKTRLAAPHTQSDKAQRVRQMFDQIAPTYQRVNLLASAGRDQAWRRETVRRAQVRPSERILDIACGTGDLSRAFFRAGPTSVVGLDFARGMLACSPETLPKEIGWVQADALRLPFADECFDIVGCAFGVRNFQSLEEGFAEMYRVLAPGGRAMILEFSMPTGRVLRRVYQFYFTRILPIMATWISRDRTGAYHYLPNSVLSFVTPPRMIHLLISAGFESASATRMTFGVVYIYRADKPPASSAAGLEHGASAIQT